MTIPQYHEFTWNNKHYRLSLSRTAELVNKSRHHICNMLKEAKAKGIPEDERMNYAIRQTPADPPYRRVKKSERARNEAVSKFIYGR